MQNDRKSFHFFYRLSLIFYNIINFREITTDAFLKIKISNSVGRHFT